ncbi:MAG: exodeoxyribonuclease III [Bacteroidota bacterium]
MPNRLIVSWNVNGIRAITKKTFVDDVKKLNPDILCLQETKATPEEVEKALVDLADYSVSANSSKAKKGYSGTAILTKEKPLDVTMDIGKEEHDQEGRVITAEFSSFFLVTVYTPNSGQGMKRLDYRSTWDQDFRNYVLQLETKKPVIICGDLNVAHREIDIARPKENYNKTSGFTQTEIDGMDAMLKAGFVDTFRNQYPEIVKYSWWNYRFKARERNVGWRIDYFLASQNAIKNVGDAHIYNDYFGSDHCPVGLEVSL